MLSLRLNREQDAVLRVLCLGAHSDDIEIGCGGTILKLIEAYPHLELTWVVFSASGERAREASESAAALLEPLVQKQIIIKAFRDGFFPYDGGEIKEFFEQMKGEISPDLIFTHYRHDLHQDHCLINSLTWNTFRDHLILEYEIPKYDGDLGVPNFYVDLDQSICERKVEHILTHFRSQHSKDWFSQETFLSVLRLRGVESRSSYTEAFYCRKLIIE
jgi:LmbE family N-acetylglucosaminyl deacetylase